MCTVGLLMIILPVVVGLIESLVLLLVLAIVWSVRSLLSLVLLLLLSSLLRELLEEVVLVIYLLKARESGLWGATAFALHQIDPDKVGALGLTDLFRPQHGEPRSLIETFHVSHRLATVVNRVEELAPLTVVAVTNFRVVELLAKLRHVVAWHVLFLLQLFDTVREGATMSKLTLAIEHHIFAHLSFLLLFHIEVEILSLLVGGKGFLDLFAGSFAVGVTGWRQA
jgi:hypothetical protein